MIVGFVAGIVLLVAFVLHSLGREGAVIDLSLFDSKLAGMTLTFNAKMVGTSIRASLDGTQRIVVTDNSITAAGFAGILLGVNNGSTETDTAGLQLDNLSVRAPGLAPRADNRTRRHRRPDPCASRRCS